MPRHKLLARRGGPASVRYLTFSTYDRLPLLGRPAIRDLLATTIQSTTSVAGVPVLAWVIMPEHVHLMLGPRDDESTIARVVSAIKGPFGKAIIKRWRSLNAPILPRLVDSMGVTRFWLPGGGFDRHVRDLEELIREVNYIHQNPVKRGLVPLQTDWPWSSARWYNGCKECPVQIGTVRMDRYDFPQQCWPRIKIDGRSCQGRK